MSVPDTENTTLLALDRYVSHLAFCDTRYDHPKRCRCGLKQTLAAIASVRAVPDTDRHTEAQIAEAHERLLTLHQRIEECVDARNFNGVRPLLMAYVAADFPLAVLVSGEGTSE